MREVKNNTGKRKYEEKSEKEEKEEENTIINHTKKGYHGLPLCPLCPHSLV